MDNPLDFDDITLPLLRLLLPSRNLPLPDLECLAEHTCCPYRSVKSPNTSTNRWTLSVIDGVKADEASQGAVSRWVYTNLNIFAPFQPLSLSRDVLLDQYLRHTGAVEEQIQTLIAAV